MSTEKDSSATYVTAIEAERLSVLENQVRELADKTKTQESGSLETKRRLEELTREAEKQTTDMVDMLANFVGSNAQDKEKESSSKGTRDEQPPEASSDRKDKDAGGTAS